MKPPATSLDKNGNLLVHPAGEVQLGHPTTLYDPNIHDDQIVVMFETWADAQAALDRLEAEGIAAGASITDRTSDGANAGVNSEGGNTGLWGSLKGLFAPDDEVHGYAEGVRRGHALLVLHPDLDTRDRVIQVLEACNPINFDARLEQWRTDGWKNLRAQEAATMGAESTARPRVGVRDETLGSGSIRRYYAPRTP
jgi:hypothetical protein